MSSNLSIEQIVDDIFAAPNDQEFANRVTRHLRENVGSVDRCVAIHGSERNGVKLKKRIQEIFDAGIRPA